MSQNKSIFVVFVVLCFRLSYGKDYFASQVGFDSLLTTERLLLSNLEKYVITAQEKLTEINGIMESISKEHPKNIDNLENYLSNPIRAFSLLKRLVITWPEINADLEDNGAKDNFVYINSLHQSFVLNYPDYEDYKGASLALARVQDTYNLNIQDLSEGIINGNKFNQSLSWLDCFQIGHTLYFAQMHRLALVWMKETERKLLLSEDNNMSNLIHLYDNIAANAIKLGLIDESVAAIEKIIELNPESSVVAARQEQLMNDLGKAERTYKQSTEYDIYIKLCRDEITPTPRHQRDLRCRYKTGPEPYLRLAAYKLEELSLDPYAAVFYDAISDREIHLIKTYAQSNIHISTVVGHPGLVDHRISKQTWMQYNYFDFLKPISQRIIDLTGLSMVNAEQFQVVNYGMGGHYEPHTDSFQKMGEAQEPHHGNRIATALFYLSDVEFGGSTAFPYLGVNVKPEKGKLLFWENTHAGGDVDYRTKHAGCPVVLGNKWIANVWLRSGDQAFRKPCGLRNDNSDSLDYQELVYTDGDNEEDDNDDDDDDDYDDGDDDEDDYAEASENSFFQL